MPGGGSGLPFPRTLSGGELREGFEQVNGQVWCEHYRVAGQRFYPPSWPWFPGRCTGPHQVGIRNSSHVLSACSVKRPPAPQHISSVLESRTALLSVCELGDLLPQFINTSPSGAAGRARRVL